MATNFGLAPCFNVTSPVSGTTHHPYKELPPALIFSIQSSLQFNTPSEAQDRTASSLKMSSTSRAWVVAASVAAVEALKDQGFCRWNYTLRSIHQRAKNRAVSSFSEASSSKKRSPQSSTAAAASRRLAGDAEARRSEESMRKVLYLSSWGPN
ncbi:uncharacterized protein LOC115679938 [Syzygium oleosum]|uniref:uncharacterized protein LOC115679938 n=1 Tax=Syzygium oleosum TaxID=219896 RepID=UPI0011D19EAE|nr:uncharacterized protein LOC115679938 [Syzygium oleosum]